MNHELSRFSSQDLRKLTFEPPSVGARHVVPLPDIVPVVRVGVRIAAAHLSFKTVLASFPAHGS